MASIQYIGRGAYRCTYSDYTTLTADGKPTRRNKRGYVLDKYGQTVKTPTQLQIKQRLNELQAYYDSIENTSKAGAAASATAPDAGTPPAHRSAHYWVSMIGKRKPCRSTRPQTVSKTMYYVNDFLTWLAVNHPTVTLGEFRRKQAEQYASTLTAYSLNTSTGIIKILSTLWMIMAEELEDEQITFSNPWQAVSRKMKEICANKVTVPVEAYSVEWIADFFRYLKSYDGRVYYNAEVYAYFHLLCVTGWRREDVRNLTWGQIDLDKRIMWCTHHKTAKTTGATSYVYLTDRTIAVLSALRDVLEHAAAQDGKEIGERLFRFGERLMYTILTDYMHDGHLPATYRRAKIGIMYKCSHSLHSFRKSCITLLKMQGIDAELVEYIVGHSSRTTEGKHYNRFRVDVEGSTRPAMEIMETVIDGTYSVDTKTVAAPTVSPLESQLAELLATAADKGMTVADIMGMISRDSDK